MRRKIITSTSWYEIVKYDCKTRKDIEVLPEPIQGLGEVNRKIKVLNALLESDKTEADEKMIYYRRRISNK